MDAITISVIIGEDRKLVVDLPADIPVGKAELTIKPVEQHQPNTTASINSRREALRTKLLAAGVLSAPMELPEGARNLTNEELAFYGQLPSGARPSEELIDEDRGEY